MPDGAGCCCCYSCCCCCCDGDGTSAAPACGGWPAPLFVCGFKYASITAKHRLRGVLVSMWERGSTNRKLKTKKYLYQTTIRYKCATRKREKETSGGICFQFPPSGRCILYFAVHGGTGRVFFFPRRDGAVFFFFRGGTGRLLFFSEAGRGGFFFFFRRDGTGRCFFFFFEGRDGTVVFGGGNFFGGTGQNRYTVPPKAV